VCVRLGGDYQLVPGIVEGESSLVALVETCWLISGGSWRLGGGGDCWLESWEGISDTSAGGGARAFGSTVGNK
jgi:hypothetical protein